MELGLRAELPNGRDAARTLIATPSTRQSGLAEYLDGWRRRVERIGTANYPTELLGNIDAGRPTLEVVIAANGTLDDIVVRRSSGDKALDQAALKILRLAAPFAPLPDEIRKEYDVLRFAYEWDFAGGAAGGR
jgi:periplasmic protein TonB